MNLVTDNMGLVGKVVKKYYPPKGYDYDDLFQVGCVGLIKAAKSYDESKIKFSSYAYVCIENEIRMLLRKKRVDTVSIDEKIKGSDDITFEDFIPSDTDIESDVSVNEIISIASRHRHRELFERYYNGWSQAELSRELGVNQPALSRRIKTFQKEIKKRIQMSS